MSHTKIACLGGGSLYFPRVLADLALADSEVVLYDIDAKKVELMAATGGSERIACEGVRGSG